MAADTGKITCVDAATGATVWTKSLKGQFFSSVVAAGDKAYLSNLSGVTTVVAIDRTFRQLAENDLLEPIYASLAPVDGRLFIRTTGHLYCIGRR
jgi:outer membrane protein assembly factor BamB